MAESLYYSWTKEFLEADEKRLAGDTVRSATGDEVKALHRERRDVRRLRQKTALKVPGRAGGALYNQALPPDTIIQIFRYCFDRSFSKTAASGRAPLGSACISASCANLACASTTPPSDAVIVATPIFCMMLKAEAPISVALKASQTVCALGVNRRLNGTPWGCG